MEQELIVNFLKNYGFIYPNSEIYNGLSNAWDYGPLGAVLKNKIKSQLLKYFVNSKPNMVLIDSSIILNSEIWKASGHLLNFSDPLIDCKNCKNRFRADKLLQEKTDILISENSSIDEIEKALIKNNILCPLCNSKKWTKVRKFNLMFKTFQGVTEDNQNTLYLRPETAQGIFINFKNIVRTQRMKLPFGVAQIGKSFRNEITPGNFIFRTREFEQMEIEYFTAATDAEFTFKNFQKSIYDFLIKVLNFNIDSIRIKEHKKDELSHYSKKTIDFEFKFPHGFSELWGLAYRGDYDLKNHQAVSGKKLTYLDPNTNEDFLPHVIEPSVGIERLFYALITNCYKVEKISENDSREVLKIPKNLAPYQMSILPLVGKLNDNAFALYQQLLENGYNCAFDSSGSIGKRYRRMDAVGTPYCITIDFDTIEKREITIRERDSMKQEKIKLKDLPKWLSRNISRF